MKHLSLFIELIRLKKPIGFMLLFWPCAWGLTLAYNFENDLNLYIFFLILFFFGSVLMRSAGCIVNDILDKKYDKKVFRTKNRPIASGKISIKLGIFYSVLLCIIAFLILINFNYLTISLAIASMPFAFTYPLIKRISYWPQLFLGITFNFGLLLGWTSINNQIDLVIIVLYIGAIFWTLGFDTIYGFQDIKDDEIIGVKSTSIKFKNNPKLVILLTYIIFINCLIYTGILMNFKIIYFLIICIIAIQLIFYQILKLNILIPNNCYKIFKSNNFVALIIFLNFLIAKYFYV